MDLAAFADEVTEAVHGICGDAVIETAEQAIAIIDVLAQRPGMDRREMASVFGVTLEQLERCRGELHGQDTVFEQICGADAVYTCNVLIARVNEAAHWKEEFRDMCNVGETDSDPEDEVEDEKSLAEGSELETATTASQIVPSSASRTKARQMLARHMEAALPQARYRLVRRLEEEILEHCGTDKEYRQCTRALVASMRRNLMLAAGYASGRIPPRWIILAHFEALAPRLMKLQRRAVRGESLKEAQLDADSTEKLSRMWACARGQNLAPPPDLEDPAT